MKTHQGIDSTDQLNGIVWCWETDEQGDSGWDLYSIDDSAKLERTFRKFHRDKQDSTLVLQRGLSTYICDVQTMQQTNLDTGFVRKIHRGWPGARVKDDSSTCSEEYSHDGEEEDSEETWGDEEEVDLLM